MGSLSTSCFSLFSLRLLHIPVQLYNWTVKWCDCFRKVGHAGIGSLFFSFFLFFFQKDPNRPVSRLKRQGDDQIEREKPSRWRESKGAQPLRVKESCYLSPQSKERKISGGLCRAVSVNTLRWIQSCLNAKRGKLDTSALGSEYYTEGKCRRLCGSP